MNLPLAWLNARHRGGRTLAAVAGVAMALVLIFVQLGFLAMARKNCVLAYRFFQFDAVILSRNYESLEAAGGFDRARLLQAEVVPGIARVAQVNYRRLRFKDPEQGMLSNACLVFGVEQKPEFLPPGAAAGLPRIARRDQIMVDVRSHRQLGVMRPGKDVVIGDRWLTIAAGYEMGVMFQANGTVMVSTETFQALAESNPREATFGLVQAAPGVTPAALVARLRAVLPDDVQVLTHAELLTRDEGYYIDGKPVGIIFRAGLTVAFAAGLAILYQVVATELTNRIRELATLKALGYTDRAVSQAGLALAALYASAAYGPALLLAWGVFRLAEAVSRIPADMTWLLAAEVLGLTIAMAAGAGWLALSKVRAADPAELF